MADRQKVKRFPTQRDLTQPTSASAVGTASPHEFYTVKQIANRLGISERSVMRDISAGILTSHKFRGSRRISESELKAYIKRSYGLTRLVQRRSSPRKKSNAKKRVNSETPESLS